MEAGKRKKEETKYRPWNVILKGTGGGKRKEGKDNKDFREDQTIKTKEKGRIKLWK